MSPIGLGILILFPPSCAGVWEGVVVYGDGARSMLKGQALIIWSLA